MPTQSSSLVNTIQQRLQQVFNPTQLEVIDESDQHHGHAAHKQGSKHFSVIIKSGIFNVMTRVAAHQRIYAELDDLMPHPLHALKIKIISDNSY